MQAYANGLSDPKFSTVGAWLGSTAEPSELFSVKRMRGSSWSKHAKSVWRLVRLPRVVTPLCEFLPLLCKLERIPRPRRESLQMPTSTALGNEDVQAIRKGMCWNVRSLIFNLIFGKQRNQGGILQQYTPGQAHTRAKLWRWLGMGDSNPDLWRKCSFWQNMFEIVICDTKRPVYTYFCSVEALGEWKTEGE